MKDLTDRALNTATSLGATYADVRIVEHIEQTVTTKNGVVGGVNQGQNRGFGVRVIAAGAWGFASSALLTAAEVDRVTALAVTRSTSSAVTSALEAKPHAPAATTRTPKPRFWPWFTLPTTPFLVATVCSR